MSFHAQPAQEIGHDPDHPIDADPSRPHDGRGDDDIDRERYPDAEDL